MKRFRTAFFGFRMLTPVLLLFLFTLTGWTTTVIKMDLPALVQESDSVVQGRVEEVYARWDVQLKTIFTYASVRVDDPLKGEPHQSVLIRQLGGKAGAMNMSIAGMPRFVRGEEVIVFLKSNPEGTYHVVGLGQGKYEIVNDFAAMNVSGVGLADRKTGKVVVDTIMSKEPLETFKSQIRRLAR